MCVNDSREIILPIGYVQVEIKLQQETVKDQFFTMGIYPPLST